jgi:hypothetical protein
MFLGMFGVVWRCEEETKRNGKGKIVIFQKRKTPVHRTDGRTDRQTEQTDRQTQYDELLSQMTTDDHSFSFLSLVVIRRSCRTIESMDIQKEQQKQQNSATQQQANPSTTRIHTRCALCLEGSFLLLNEYNSLSSKSLFLSLLL